MQEMRPIETAVYKGDEEILLWDGEWLKVGYWSRMDGKWRANGTEGEFINATHWAPLNVKIPGINHAKL